MAYTKYSLVPDDNNSAPPNGAPEGMLPSGVNNTMRDMMAQIRDVGDGIRDGTYAITNASITGGSVFGITDLAIADGGTGQSTASGAFNALSPITTTGDLIIGNGTNSATRLAIGTAGTVLQSDGTTATWTAASGGGVEIGALQYFAGATTTTYPSSDWLLCDGSILTQTAYPTLFNRLGLIVNGLDVWTARTSETASNINALTYGNGIFVYAGNGGAVGTSTNAITWTARTSPTVSNLNALIYANNLFVYGGNTSALATSTDAITWTARTSGAGGNIQSLAYGNNTYVFGVSSGLIRTSTDAITWTSRTSGTASQINALIYANNLFVYGGVGGVLATSTDAITWTAQTSGTASNIVALTYGNGVFVYGGAGGVLATSTDAITWTARTSGTVSQINELVYGDNIFVYGANAGNLRTSTDAITWTARTSGTASSILALAHGADTFVFGGTAGYLKSGGIYTYDRNTEFTIPATTNVKITTFDVDLLFIKAE